MNEFQKKVLDNEFNESEKENNMVTRKQNEINQRREPGRVRQKKTECQCHYSEHCRNSFFFFLVQI